jgi:hypothetical protein
VISASDNELTPVIATDPRHMPGAFCTLSDPIAPSNGMDAKRSAAVPLSSPVAAQRGAKGAGLDSGTAAAAQSVMPSIALPCHLT